MRVDGASLKASKIKAQAERKDISSVLLPLDPYQNWKGLSSLRTSHCRVVDLLSQRKADRQTAKHDPSNRNFGHRIR